jgi:predicted GNAT family acetyltransferase
LSLEVLRHTTARAFLRRAERWLLEAEDLHNLILSLSYASAAEEAAAGRGTSTEAPLFATVERRGEVVGCAYRAPPHQLLLTDMPGEAVEELARAVASAHPAIPAALGTPELARAFAAAWTRLTGAPSRPGTDQRLYRLDAVLPIEAPGTLRAATPDELPLAAAWAEAFSRDVHLRYGPGENRVAGWVEDRCLFFWEEGGEPVSMAVAHGATPRGIRIGYVYTPPDRRRRGYAGACVAELSRRLLAAGRAFCVLYADLSNPTTNALYQRMGYKPVADVTDYYFT